MLKMEEQDMNYGSDFSQNEDNIDDDFDDDFDDFLGGTTEQILISVENPKKRRVKKCTINRKYLKNISRKRLTN